MQIWRKIYPLPSLSSWNGHFWTPFYVAAQSSMTTFTNTPLKQSKSLNVLVATRAQKVQVILVQWTPTTDINRGRLDICDTDVLLQCAMEYGHRLALKISDFEICHLFGWANLNFNKTLATLTMDNFSRGLQRFFVIHLKNGPFLINKFWLSLSLRKTSKLVLHLPRFKKLFMTNHHPSDKG